MYFHPKSSWCHIPKEGNESEFFLQSLENFQSSLCSSDNDDGNGNVDDALIFSITELELKMPTLF